MVDGPNMMGQSTFPVTLSSAVYVAKTECAISQLSSVNDKVTSPFVAVRVLGKCIGTVTVAGGGPESRNDTTVVVPS